MDENRGVFTALVAQRKETMATGSYEMLKAGGTTGAVTGKAYTYTQFQVFMVGKDCPDGEFAHLGPKNCKATPKGPGRPPKTANVQSTVEYETAAVTSDEIETQPVRPKAKKKSKASTAKS